MSEPRSQADAASFAAKLQAAWLRRRALHERSGLDTYRIFHGASEGLPGLDIERYAHVLVVDQRRAIAPEVIGAILPELDRHHVFDCAGLKVRLRHSADPQACTLRMLRGERPSAPVALEEDGLRFFAEPLDRESTGLFLDARPVRQWLRHNSRDRRVLDLFSHTGSLGVAALCGGARRVVHVDAKRSPLKRAEANHRLNGLEVDVRDFMRGDVYVHLPRAARSSQMFEGIILDPPPQMPRRKNRKPRGQDYPNLVPLVTPLLAAGGWLLCLFHGYGRTLAECEAELAEHSPFPLRVAERLESGSDFPASKTGAKLWASVFVRD